MQTDELGIRSIDYTIRGDLMFSTVFHDAELCRGLIETLLDVEIESVQMVVPQRKIQVAPLSRAGIVDVLARDASGRIFDVEMQNRMSASLPRRARYYGSLMDVAMLGRGENFDQLPSRAVIFICPHKPVGYVFQDDLKRYTCVTVCRQNGREVDDGQLYMFVNASGTQGESTPELDAFLSYVRDQSMIGSDYIRQVDEAVRALSDDPTWRRDLMLWSEKYRDEFYDAREAGRAVGLEEGRQEGREKGLEEGRAVGLQEGRAVGLQEGRQEGRKKGREEGLQEGLEEGRNQQLEELSRLAEALEERGRSSELSEALRDGDLRESLLKEFGIRN